MQIKDFELFSDAVNNLVPRPCLFGTTVELPSELFVLLSTVYRRVAHVVSQIFPILLRHLGPSFFTPDQVSRLIFISAVVFSQFPKTLERLDSFGEWHSSGSIKTSICIYDVQKRVPIDPI